MTDQSQQIHSEIERNLLHAQAKKMAFENFKTASEQAARLGFRTSFSRQGSTLVVTVELDDFERI